MVAETNEPSLTRLSDTFGGRGLEQLMLEADLMRAHCRRFLPENMPGTIARLRNEEFGDVSIVPYASEDLSNPNYLVRIYPAPKAIEKFGIVNIEENECVEIGLFGNFWHASKYGSGEPIEFKKGSINPLQSMFFRTVSGARPVSKSSENRDSGVDRAAGDY